MKIKFKRRQLFKTIIQIAQEMFLTLSSDLKNVIKLQPNLLAHGNFLMCPCSGLSAFEISTFHELTEDCVISFDLLATDSLCCLIGLQ